MGAGSVRFDTTEPLGALARRALGFVKDDTAVGLGAGRAATAFVRALAARVRDGLRVRGVPVSEATAELAEELGIPLVGLEAEIDITVDGADEVDPDLNLIKGYGGALLRERRGARSSSSSATSSFRGSAAGAACPSRSSRSRCPCAAAASPPSASGPRSGRPASARS